MNLSERREKARLAALDLCKMCKRKNLTVSEFSMAVEFMNNIMSSTTTVMDRLPDSAIPEGLHPENTPSQN